jgi:hypothetical protein
MSGVAALDLPGDDRVAHHADAVGVGDHDRTVEKAGVVDPGGAGHFAVAVEGEPGGEDGVVGSLAAGMDGGDAGAHGPLPTTSLPLPEMSVVWPTSTPLTSVMALLGPGVPSKGRRDRGRAAFGA